MSSGGRITRLTSKSRASASTSSASSSSSETRGKRGQTSVVACPAPKTPKMDDNSTAIEFIEKFLECGVCLDFSTSPIHSCDNGHVLCGQCAPKLGACPTCRNKKLSPNPVGEKLAKEVHKMMKCVNSGAGCKEMILSTKFKDHLICCHFGEMKCMSFQSSELRKLLFIKGPFIKVYLHVQGEGQRKRYTFTTINDSFS